MFRRIAILVLGTAAAWVIFFLPMNFMANEASAEVVVLAAAICLAPGIVELVAFGRLRDKPPEAKIVGVLLATAFRMGAALGGGILLYSAFDRVREQVFPFVSWAVVFYIATLFIETQLLYIDNSASTKTGPSGS